MNLKAILSKFLCTSAAVLVTASAAPAIVSFAVSTTDDSELTDGTFSYELGDKGYTIIDCEPTAIFTEIPEMRNGYAIVAIGDQAFAGCEYITDITIPDTVKEIGQYSFAGCSSLKSVRLPSNLKEIPNGAFAGCDLLTTVEFSDKIEKIGIRSFLNCSALESPRFPDTLTSIGDYAFQSCYSITELDLPSSLTSIGELAFGDCASIETITAESNPKFIAEDNILYSKDKKTLYRAAVKGLDENFYIPDTVSVVAGGAFSYCTELSAVFIPSSVTEVGEAAFNFCTGLKSVDFSAGLTQIAPFAFEHCTALTTVSFPTTLTSVGAYSFFDCASLEKVLIPEGVTLIDEGAFTACPKLLNVVVPSSAATIGDYAFGFTANSDGSAFEPVSGFSMSVNSGTAAEKYAKKSDLEYNVMDVNIKKIAFIIIGVAALLAAAVFAVVLMHRGKKNPAPRQEDDAEDENYSSILSDSEKNDEK